MKKFEPGKSYYDRSACDHNCIFAYTIKKRTAKTAVIVDRNGKEYRKRIYIYGDEENISLGSYSMAPVLSAWHELPGEGTLAERLDEMHRADADRDHRAFLQNVIYQNFKRFSDEYEGGIENVRL